MSSSHAHDPASPEQGDYIVNWHLQYCSDFLLQGETVMRSLANQIKSELNKLKVDQEFIQNNYDGPHKNLMRLKATERDLKSIMDFVRDTGDRLRKSSTTAASRII